MLLTIDIGNTNITLGLYQNETLKKHWRMATNHERMPDEYGIMMSDLLDHSGVKAADLQGVCMASVVPPLTSRVIQACNLYLNADPLNVDYTTKTGIKIKIDEPKSVGADRIVDVVAVNKFYGGPACVVDFGTATTFDAVDATGAYLGGAIAPGIGISAEALVTYTAQLPRVNLQAPPNVIGKNTIHAMQSGLLFGYVGMVEGMVARFRKQLGTEMKVIATGGLAELVAEHTEIIQITAPWLTLDGLRLIWEMNH
ncbi:MAG: type III pantothenate kinase [Anaerolineaceae bacterium]